MNIRDCLLLELLRSENLDSRIRLVPGGMQGARVEKAREQRWLARRQRWICRREYGNRKQRLVDEAGGNGKIMRRGLMNARFWGREMLSRNSAQRVNIINFLEEW